MIKVWLVFFLNKSYFGWIRHQQKFELMFILKDYLQKGKGNNSTPHYTILQYLFMHMKRSWTLEYTPLVIELFISAQVCWSD